MIFAKLFEQGDHQVLVVKDCDEDFEPEIHFKFKSNVSHHSVTVKVQFNGKTVEEREKARDKAFKDVDIDVAFDIRNNAPGVNL